MRRRPILFALAAMTVPALAGAQLLSGGPLRNGLGGLVGGVADTLPLDQVDRLSPVRAAQELLAARVDRLSAFVRRNRDSVALDDHDNPAVRDTVLIDGASAAALQAVRQAGYAVAAERIEGLDLNFARATLPDGISLTDALRAIRALVPDAEVSADTIHFPSGAAPAARTAALAGMAGEGGKGAPAGLIDGGVAAQRSLAGHISQRGFARGAPIAIGHATAVASLIAGTGPVKGSAPGAPLLVADVYGTDPAGGGALAIARALGWLAANHVTVTTISLVGPPNPLLARAVAQARSRGMAIVAAVGNDGPAAPPAFPASYPGVIAVTGVDGRNRALIEAGRALHLDYAAPGADMGAARASGGVMRVRGTSFAAPLVAGRLYMLRQKDAAARPAQMLDKEAKDLGAKGPDRLYGRGLRSGLID